MEHAFLEADADHPALTHSHSLPPIACACLGWWRHGFLEHMACVGQMPRSPKVTQENKPIISINLLHGVLLIRLKLFRDLRSGKYWKLVMEDPWPLLGFSFIPSCCSEPRHVSCQVLMAPSPVGFVLRVQIPSLPLPILPASVSGPVLR